jgi:hypothetical protein
MTRFREAAAPIIAPFSAYALRSLKPVLAAKTLLNLKQPCAGPPEIRTRD